MGTRVSAQVLIWRYPGTFPEYALGVPGAPTRVLVWGTRVHTRAYTLGVPGCLPGY